MAIPSELRAHPSSAVSHTDEIHRTSASKVYTLVVHTVSSHTLLIFESEYIESDLMHRPSSVLALRGLSKRS
jgi:hypothetical protein